MPSHHRNVDRHGRALLAALRLPFAAGLLTAGLLPACPLPAGLLLAGLLSAAFCASGPAQTTPLPTLTTVNAVHTLSHAEAARSYPVHLKAAVVYYDPFLNYPGRPIVMVDDSTASIYVAIVDPPSPDLKAGALVEVIGESNPGDFGPNISNAHLHVIGTASLPAHPPRQSLTHLLTGSEDAQFVELEGVVKWVEINGGNVTLKLALADGELAATTVKEPDADYARLVDSKVLIHGIAGSLFNRKGQIFGEQLLFPGLSALQIEEPAFERPFERPLKPVSSLMQYEFAKVFTHRTHLRGIVTLFWPGRMICLQDLSASLCAQTRQTAPVLAGQRVDLIGFPQIGAVTPTLSDATYKLVPGPQAAHIAVIDAKQAFSAVYDSQLVQIKGRLIAHDRASQDPTFVVSSGNYTFPVILAKSSDARAFLDLNEGSLLNITGICSVQADSQIFTRHDGYPIAMSFQILVNSSHDVVVLERPSWWNQEHTLRVLACAFAIALAALGYTVFLTVRIRQQGKLMHYQATHDGLTDIWNRKAVLDLMRREFEIALRSNKCLGVMMLDADHFKNINDTYGHPAGDTVLREIARRIQDSLRAYDLTGRYGGEEFLIVLPACSREELYDCAERVRDAVASKPIHAEEVPLLVTVSVGIAVLDPSKNSEKEALAAADSALYEAKRTGRNRVVSVALQARSTLTRAV